jgi:catalase
MKLAEAKKLAGADPKYHTNDMWNHIAAGKFPQWILSAQVMTPQQAKSYKWNIFDMTKVWPHKDFPLQPMAKLTLNKNVSHSVENE